MNPDKITIIIGMIVFAYALYDELTAPNILYNLAMVISGLIVFVSILSLCNSKKGHTQEDKPGSK